jgi:hypothetical protein
MQLRKHLGLVVPISFEDFPQGQETGKDMIHRSIITMVKEGTNLEVLFSSRNVRLTHQNPLQIIAISSVGDSG